MLIPTEILWLVALAAVAVVIYLVLRKFLPQVMVGERIDRLAEGLKNIKDQNTLLARIAATGDRKLVAIMTAIDTMENGTWGPTPPSRSPGLTQEDILGSADERRQQLEAEGLSGEALNEKIEEEKQLFKQLDKSFPGVVR
jgi:hypothetical protein